MLPIPAVPFKCSSCGRKGLQVLSEEIQVETTKSRFFAHAVPWEVQVS